MILFLSPSLSSSLIGIYFAFLSFSHLHGSYFQTSYWTLDKDNKRDENDGQILSFASVRYLCMFLNLLQMASGVPLTARALAQSNPNDLQRIANPSLEVNERRLRPIYDYMEIHK